jgi:hypothetical protein
LAQCPYRVAEYSPSEREVIWILVAAVCEAVTNTASDGPAARIIGVESFRDDHLSVPIAQLAGNILATKRLARCVARRSNSGFRRQYPRCSLGDDIAVPQRCNLVDVPPHNELAARIFPIPIITTNTRGWERLVRKMIVLLFFIGIYIDDVRLDEFTDIGISFF